jgi:hypothetical protein
VQIRFRNRGPATAHGLVPWLQPATYPVPPPYEGNPASALEAGDDTTRPHHLAADYTSGTLNVWVTWRDKRGQQVRDTGTPIILPPTP